MDINLLLEKLGDEIGLKGLGLDSDQLCTLRFDSKDIIVIEVPPPGHRAYLYSMLFRIPEHDKATFYERLLEANLFGKETGAAAFSCNPKTNEVFLTRTVELDDLTYDAFKNALEELLQCIEYWREQHEQGQLLHGRDEPVIQHVDELNQQQPLDTGFV